MRGGRPADRCRRQGQLDLAEVKTHTDYYIEVGDIFLSWKLNTWLLDSRGTFWNT
ncbi:hypothetical protein LEMLEM_LOCUS6284 [Lemmus lemmus]